VKRSTLNKDGRKFAESCRSRFLRERGDTKSTPLLGRRRKEGRKAGEKRTKGIHQKGWNIVMNSPVKSPVKGNHGKFNISWRKREREGTKRVSITHQGQRWGKKGPECEI